MKRRKFTAEFKTQIVLSLLSGKMSMAQICKKHSLKDSVVSRWKAQFLQNAPSIFANKEERDNSQEEKIANLERLVGQLTMEKEILKKASNLLKSL